MTIEYSEDNAQRADIIGDPENSSDYRFLDTAGDGSGNKDMNTTAALYFIEAAEGEILVIDEIKITLSDAALLQSGLFGGLGALTLGCLLQITESREGQIDLIKDLTDGEPLTINEDLYALGDVDLLNNAAGSILTVSVRHKPIRLQGTSKQKERLSFQVQDNLAGLTYMRVAVRLTDYSNNLG